MKLLSRLSGNLLNTEILIASEWQLSVLNSLTEHIALLDKYGNIILVNEAWKKFANDNQSVQNNYFVGQNYISISESASGEDALCGKSIALAVEDILSGKLDKFSAEYACDSETEKRWFRINITPVSNSRKAGAVISHTNITGTKTIESDLFKEKQKLRAIIENMDAGVMVADKSGSVTLINKTAEQILGTATIEESPDKWVTEYGAFRSDKKTVFPSDELPLVKAIKGIKTSNIEMFIRNASKPEGVFLLVHGSPLIDEKGEVSAGVIVIRDITNRKLAKDELQRSERKYRQMIETVQEGIWMIDKNIVTSFVNKKMEEILGYTAEEMVGRPIFDFMDEEGKERALKHMERRRMGIYENYDAKYMTKYGKLVWTNLSTNFIYDEDGKFNGALAMVTDITNRKLAEETLRMSEASLAIKNKELVSKNRELEQFAYIASHDLQEPLRSISGFANMLLEQYQGNLDKNADKSLHFITQSAERMKILIKDLLEYSRIGRNTMWTDVDCSNLIQEVLADLDMAVKESGAYISCGNLPVVNGNPTELKQLFQNLIINAIKFRKKDQQPNIQISADNKNGIWEFAFKDNGIGIEEQHNERIFIIFQRLHTRKEYEGSGIGLSHCKKIVELHGGKIWLKSLAGQGSTFYFTIPEKHIL